MNFKETKRVTTTTTSLYKYIKGKKNSIKVYLKMYKKKSVIVIKCMNFKSN